MFADLEGYILYVTELDAGRDFYNRILQLPIIEETKSRLVFHIPRSKLILKMDANGSPPLSVQPGTTGDVPGASGGSALVLLVEDVDTSAFYLHKCGVAFTKPIGACDGLWMCEVSDPYGNRIAIAQLNEVRG